LNAFDLLVLEKKIFKKFQFTFTRLLLSPLEEVQPPFFNKLESPLPKDDLRQVWLKLAQWFWRRSRKCKSLQTDRRTTGDENSSLELSAQVS
jgi:hypothetical protein